VLAALLGLSACQAAPSSGVAPTAVPAVATVASRTAGAVSSKAVSAVSNTAVSAVSSRTVGVAGGTSTGARPVLGNAGIPAFTHVFVIVLENATFEQVIQANTMPYLNHLGSTYSVATHYYAITHPSLPNYLALLGGSTFGITSDCLTCSVSGPNLVDQLEQQSKRWQAYMEGMPTACSPLPLWPFGQYAKKHNPFLYFADIRNNPQRCRHVLPFSSFRADLAAGNVADFTWITPDFCHDGHDCSLAQSDHWLSETVPTILNSTAYRQGGALFITFDEAADGATSGCCHLARGGRVFTLVTSPFARSGGQISVPYDHYALLRTIEDAWKLPHLAGAADPATPNMAAAFSTA
jgi:hypothetical protein